MAESEMQIWMTQMEERIVEMAAQLEFLNQAVEHLNAQQQGMQAAPAPRSGAPSPSPHRLHRIKPAPLLDFSGDRAKGRAFLNSCKLYM
jgi:hypothetical protein